MEITRELLGLINTDIENAFITISKKHGVDLKTGKCLYEANRATMQIRFTATGEDGKVLDLDRMNYAKWAHLYGLKTEWLDKTYFDNGTTYKIVGLREKARTRPLLIEDVKSGTRYVTAVERIPQLMAA